MDQILCPIPYSQYPHILLAHGGGGKLMDDLIHKLFVPCFGDVSEHDGAFFESDGKKMVMTTDSFVVSPLFFPGGSIGKLAVYGTVNDLAMCGAKPLYLSLSFILEEGLPIKKLWEICLDIKAAAFECNVKIITGDTKVVEKGKGDGIFINTTGVGSVIKESFIPQNIQDDDVILVNGELGLHGMAIMAQREELGFSPPLESDCANLSSVVMKLIESGVIIHCLRDLTRGGLASTMNELARQSKKTFKLIEKDIPISESVRSSCDLLGLNPFMLACEGRMALIMPKDQSPKAIEILSQNGFSSSTIIGQVLRGLEEGDVLMQNPFGVTQYLEQPVGDQLPRIC